MLNWLKKLKRGSDLPERLYAPAMAPRFRDPHVCHFVLSAYWKSQGRRVFKCVVCGSAYGAGHNGFKYINARMDRPLPAHI